jgi:ABC-type multidrug transport system fused ATPase/permease subunit
VGLNGCGKTTFVKLLTGLIYPDEGQIEIGGIDSLTFDSQEYRQMFSVVFQDISLYASSLLENVMGSDQDSSQEERAIECLKLAGLEEKIETLPLKYHQPLLKIIEDNGVDLSFGEIQKIAIARALYKNGDIVVLDEPTASLDALAEAKIYQQFNEMVCNKTALFISHRLVSTRFCDRIAYFEDGRVLELGTHDELMALHGKYYNLFITQGKYYQEGASNEESL